MWVERGISVWLGLGLRILWKSIFILCSGDSHFTREDCMSMYSQERRYYLDLYYERSKSMEDEMERSRREL